MRMCRASFIFSSLIGFPGLVKDGSLTPLDGMLECSATTDVSMSAFLWVLFQSGLKPPDGLTNVDPPTVTGGPVDNLGAFLLGNSVLDLGLHGTERLSRFEDSHQVCMHIRRVCTNYIHIRHVCSWYNLRVIFKSGCPDRCSILDRWIRTDESLECGQGCHSGVTVSTLSQEVRGLWFDSQLWQFFFTLPLPAS